MFIVNNADREAINMDFCIVKVIRNVLGVVYRNSTFTELKTYKTPDEAFKVFESCIKAYSENQKVWYVPDEFEELPFE